MSKRVTVIVEGREYVVEVGDLSDSPIKATVNNRTYDVHLPRPGPDSAGLEAPPAPVEERAAPSPPESASSAMTAPMPGNIVEVKVRVGDSVQSGDVLCVLDAMKMNNMIHSDRAAIIASVEVIAGQAVDFGAVLVTFQ